MLIVGLGNPYGGDDAAGILVAKGLTKRGIKALTHEGSPLDLVNLWRPADCVIVVDAMSSCSTPGTIQTWDASIVDLPADAFRSSTHSFELAETIRLARMLDRLPKRLTVYGIEAARFSAGASPSPPVLKAVERAIDDIASTLSKIGDYP